MQHHLSLLPSMFLSWKYLGFLVLVVFGWIMLYRSRSMKEARLGAQVVSFIIFGGVAALFIPWFGEQFGLHPSPMCSITKGGEFIAARGVLPAPMMALIIAAVVFTLVGGKAFCGWACPLGALQELVGRIPGLPRKRMPFKLSNSIRISAFAIFVVVLIGWQTNTFNWFNPFEILHWSGLASPFVWGPALVVVVLSLVFYRPFCALLCPMGLVTWVVESLSLGKIRVTSECDDCGTCLQKTDCQALPAIIEGRRVVPDCHGCGDCLPSCKRGFIAFAFGGGRSRIVKPLQ